MDRGRPSRRTRRNSPAEQRIWPAIRDLSGLVGIWVLRDPQSATVVCILATSPATLDAITHVVMASELLPGEDVALLPRPDRIGDPGGHGLSAGRRPAGQRGGALRWQTP